MKTIVTGGAGFIGSHIVDALVGLGHEVHIVDNMSAGKQENINSLATFHNVDICDYGKLLPLFKDIDYVFHHAAMPQVEYSIQNPIETNEINVNGLLNVLEACRVNKVKRLMFASSSAVYGDQDILPLVETMDSKPLSPYGAHKYIGEIYCKLYSKIYGVETVSFRYMNVFGPRQSATGSYSSVIPRFIEFKKQNKPMTIVGDGNQTRNFVHVSDVVNANLLAMESNKVGNGEVINIGSEDQYSVNKIAELLEGDSVYIEPRIEPRASSADNTKARELLGWEPKVSLEKGLEELKKYYSIT